MSKTTRRLPPVATIAIAQLFGTSLWFSANSATDELMQRWNATAADIGWLTSAVQVGFILGTLVFALGGLADRYRASRIFVYCALAGALCNAGFAWLSQGLASGMLLRFLVGLTLAGIYPIGMKLIVSWAPERTGQALAHLVAMLTLGTALPHALREAGASLPWQGIITASSLLALFGALLVLRLGDGPHLPNAPAPRSMLGGIDAFRVPRFRAAALGYFGHMWELYTFWTLVPLLVASVLTTETPLPLGVAGLSFVVIAMGALGCWVGGALSQRVGSAKVALSALAASGLCALAFALFWQVLPASLLMLLLLVWGAMVIADSPQFSSLAARACPQERVGAALAIMNSLGFALTVVSIAVTTALFEHLGLAATWLLVPGPILGLAGYAWATRRCDAR